MLYFYFLTAVLATWRITHLLSKEDGPFEVIFLLRKKLRNRVWGSLVDCFYCLSIWTSLPAGFWLGKDWKEIICYWLAVSGAACLLEKLTAKEQPVQYYEEE